MAKIIGYINLYDSPSLGELTKHRTPASTSFLGRYALIDFALSNFANSHINNINILIKDNFRSVAKHCGSLKPWATNTRIGSQNYLINERGIADPDYNSDLNAIRENDWVLFDTKADYIVIQPAHIITRINIRKMISEHIASGAEISMAYTSIKDGNEAFLTSSVITRDKDKVSSIKLNDGKKKNVDISLRTYVFSRKIFDKILSKKDYRTALSLRMLMTKIINENLVDVHAYKYEGYARCFDSLEHFVQYSFELLDLDVAKTLFDKNRPVYTITRNTPPAIYGEKADVKNSFVANGANINGKVQNSIISRYVTVEEGAIVKNSIILTKTVIKKGSHIENVVVDKYSCLSSDISSEENKPLYLKQGTKK